MRSQARSAAKGGSRALKRRLADRPGELLPRGCYSQESGDGPTERGALLLSEEEELATEQSLE